MQRILIGGHCAAAVALSNAPKAQQLEEVIVTGQQVVGIEAGHGLPYDYKRRFGVSLRMDF